MAEFMNKNLHEAKIPACKGEIKRLTALKESTKTRFKQNSVALSVQEVVFGKAKILQKKKVQEDYYNAVNKHIQVKIIAWEQFINYAKDENILDRLNESMDEWLQKSWLYLGQEDIQEESKNAIDEFAMFKRLLTQVPNKTKKPRRRGGKKHKKKNKDVWDEVM